MWRWCSLHAPVVRKTTKYTASCSTSKKQAWKTSITCLSPHTLMWPSTSTTYQQLYSTRPLQLPGKTATRCVSHLMTWHHLTSAVWDFSMVWWPPVPLHTAQNLVKRKNLIATWHWCQLHCNCDHQISTSISLKCWWHRVFSCHCTVVDVNHHGKWAQIFGGKTSKPETFGPVVKRNFYLCTCISHPHWGHSVGIS